MLDISYGEKWRKILQHIPLKSKVWSVVKASVRISGPLVEFATSIGIASLLAFAESPRSKEGGAPRGL